MSQYSPSFGRSPVPSPRPTVAPIAEPELDCSECAPESSRAFRFTSYMDDTMNPCDNFYRYSCGNFHRQELDKQKNFVELQTDATRRTLYGLLSAADANDTSRTAKLARSLFSSCMDISRRANLGYAPLLDRLKNLPCGPILAGCNFNEKSYSWERHSGMLGWYAAQYNFVIFGTDVNPEDRSQITLQIQPPDLSKILDPVREDLIHLANPGPTEIDTLLQVQLRQNLTKSTIFQLMEPDEKQRQDMLDEVAQLMLDINKIATATPSNITDMTFGELKQIVSKIAWNDLLFAELSTLIKLTDTTPISVMNLSYFEQLAQAMSRFSAQTLANYLVVVTAKHLEQFVYSEQIQPTYDGIMRFISGRKGSIYIVSAGNNAWRTWKSLSQFKSYTLSTISTII
ncbi:hypothetical protein Y032_0184g972 [Ancylostoma ceylanicum]|uniref:Peptidase M13 N-terminal domain-containing protein n=2 Tax=Ancylostoma ceylanicum TaxID=53326 RepID=A0A016SSE0_9BILA|nr:hypothetical protein Y032_0184g972 [Ancylostoma ceylanicum]